MSYAHNPITETCYPDFDLSIKALTTATPLLYILTRRLPKNVFELWVSLSIFCVIIRNPAKSIYLKNIPQPSAFFPIAVLITVFIGCVFFTVVFEVFVCLWPQFGLNLRQESRGTREISFRAIYYRLKIQLN